LLPSAEEVTNNCFIFVKLFEAQVKPPSADVYIEPPESPAASLVPSAEQAKETPKDQVFGTLFDIQVFPEFVEVTPEQNAASREVFHVTPEFVEV